MALILLDDAGGCLNDVIWGTFPSSIENSARFQNLRKRSRSRAHEPVMVLENLEFQLNQHKFEWDYRQIVNWLLAIIIMKKRQKKNTFNLYPRHFIEFILTRNMQQQNTFPPTHNNTQEFSS